MKQQLKKTRNLHSETARADYGANWQKSLGRYLSVVGGTAAAFTAGHATAAVLYTDVNPDLTTAFNGNEADSLSLYIDFDGQSAATGAYGNGGSNGFAGADYFTNYAFGDGEKPEFQFDTDNSNFATGQIAKTGANYNYVNKFGFNKQVGPSYSQPPINVTDGTLWANNGWLENNVDDAPWSGGGAGFVGVRFAADDSGQNYNYGWAQIRYDDNANTMTLLDFAYETELNTAITTTVPEPHSLMLVALGASGLSLLRRRQAT
jgi:hypothetical protein